MNKQDRGRFMEEQTIQRIELETEGEAVETLKQPTKSGIVANCVKLNLRENPTIQSKVLETLKVKSKVKIDFSKSNNDWYFTISETGNKGYCMNDYIEIV